MTVTVSGNVVPIQRLGYQPFGQYDLEKWDDSVKTTKLVLVDEPVPLVSVTTGAGVGGRKIFTFPPGFIKRLGCRARLTGSVVAAEQADYTDGNYTISVGVGTLAPANADAFGTDATDDDWGTGATMTFTSFAGAAMVIATEADGIHDGTTTPVSLFLNSQVAAADIDDSITTEWLASGSIWFTWVNQGGYA